MTRATLTNHDGSRFFPTRDEAMDWITDTRGE